MSDETPKGLTIVRAAIILMVVGAVLFIGGWVYDVLFAGILAPDPTPEMKASWDLHKTIASYIRFGAIGAWGLSILLFAWASFSKDDAEVG